MWNSWDNTCFQAGIKLLLCICLSIKLVFKDIGIQWMQQAAHHSPPRPPVGGSLDGNRTVILGQCRLYRPTSNRKTHYPATPKTQVSTGCSRCFLENVPCVGQFTWQGLVGGVEVGDVSGSSLLAGSNTHSLEKEMPSSATRPRGPSPRSYL